MSIGLTRIEYTPFIGKIVIADPRWYSSDIRWKKVPSGWGGEGRYIAKRGYISFSYNKSQEFYIYTTNEHDPIYRVECAYREKIIKIL